MFPAARLTRISLRPLGRMALLPALFALLLALPACKPPPKVDRGNFPLPKDADISPCTPGKYGGTMVLSESTEPKTFNPDVEATDQTSDEVQSLFLSGLVNYDPMTKTEDPFLAKSWDLAPDKKTYTFHLRQGVKWNDGQPFTADDVIFTFDCIFAETTDPATGQPKPRYPNRYTDELTFAGKRLQYRKIDDYTVEFYTPEIFSPFVHELAAPIYILPKHKLEKSFEDGSFLQQWTSQTGIDHPEELVGTGPFVVRSYTPGERMVFSPNPHFWRADHTGQRLPYLDFLILQFVATYETEVMLFATGQTDSLLDSTGIPPTDVPWVKKGEKIYGFTLYPRGPNADSWFLWFNQKSGVNKDGVPYLAPYKRAWFTNKLFRQAVMYGLNRQGIAQGVYLGLGEPAKSVINQGNPTWFNPNVRQYPFDPAKARELLKEAGFHWDAQGQLFDSSGNRVQFELLLYEGVRRVIEIATVFKDNMKDLGIDVKLTFVDFGVLLHKSTETFDYDMTGMGWGSPSGETDQSDNKSLFSSSGIYHFWNPEEKNPATDWEKQVDDLVDLQEQTFDRADRIRIFGQIQAIYAEQMPLYYIIDAFQFSGIKNKWHNVRVPPSGTLLWNIEEFWTEPPSAQK